MKVIILRDGKYIVATYVVNDDYVFPPGLDARVTAREYTLEVYTSIPCHGDYTLEDSVMEEIEAWEENWDD